MYKLHKNLAAEINAIIRQEDGAFIPFNLANTDYQEYLKWVALGNTPEPAENT
jgi:hypothetical protein